MEGNCHNGYFPMLTFLCDLHVEAFHFFFLIQPVKGNQGEQKLTNGLVAGHAYSVTDLREVSYIQVTDLREISYV
jgi:hypothetical protein